MAWALCLPASCGPRFLRGFVADQERASRPPKEPGPLDGALCGQSPAERRALGKGGRRVRRAWVDADLDSEGRMERHEIVSLNSGSTIYQLGQFG